MDWADPLSFYVVLKLINVKIKGYFLTVPNISKEEFTMRVSEIFYSVQGEGRRVGEPSLFVRFFGCNFRCPGFGLPLGKLSTEPDEIAKNVSLYKSYSELPLAKTGCDSYPSWHPKFAQFSPEMTEEELYNRMINTVPKEALERGIDIVFTGGEPLLPKTQKFIIEMFKKFNFRMFRNVTFETNGSQKVFPELVDVIEDQTSLLFSVSPKLKCSGVPREKAIVPESLRELSKNSMYLKFVVSSKEDLDEIEDIYDTVDWVDYPRVYIMPEGGVPERYNQNLRKVAELAMKNGYVLSPRLHITLFGNSWGT